MSIQSEQDIVEFQITVDDSILVEVFESETDFGGVEPATDRRNQYLNILVSFTTTRKHTELVSGQIVPAECAASDRLR